MNLKQLILIFFILLGSLVKAQPNEYSIDSKLYNEFNLYKLAKVWGIAKYRHPKIGNSEIDWDEALKEFIELTDYRDFDERIYNWFNTNIPINDYVTKSANDSDTLDVLVKANYKWLNNKILFSNDLISYLNKLIKLEPVSLDSHQYVSNGKWKVTPLFKENSFSESTVWDSKYLKLLTLFRYWNIIEYFHPYKYLNSNDWDKILVEFIPRFLEKHSELSFKLLLMELFSKIEDSHSGLYDKTIDTYLGNKQVPLELIMLDNEVLIKHIFKNLKNNLSLNLGDVITHIDGVSVSALIYKHKKTITASNVYAFNRELTQRLIRTSKDSVRLTTISNGHKNEVYIKTNPYSILNYIHKKVPSHKTINGNIGYIYPGSLKSENEFIKILNKFKHKKAIILDYRCYPSVVIQHIFPKFLFPNSKPYYKATHFDWNELGQFYYERPVEIGGDNPNYYKGKLVVLINEFSTSQPEFETLAYRKAPNSIIIGTNSGGTIGNYTTIPLPGTINTIMSGAEVRDIDGTQIQKKGIIPDILIELSKEGISKGKDEILERAIEIINKH